LAVPEQEKERRKKGRLGKRRGGLTGHGKNKGRSWSGKGKEANGLIRMSKRPHVGIPQVGGVLPDKRDLPLKGKKFGEMRGISRKSRKKGFWGGEKESVRGCWRRPLFRRRGARKKGLRSGGGTPVPEEKKEEVATRIGQKETKGFGGKGGEKVDYGKRKKTPKGRNAQERVSPHRRRVPQNRRSRKDSSRKFRAKKKTHLQKRKRPFSDKGGPFVQREEKEKKRQS